MLAYIAAPWIRHGYINIQNQPKLQDPLEETQETQEPQEVSQASVLVPAMTLER